MKKRLFCLLLALIMVIPMILLTACSDDEEEADVSESLGAHTITMRLISEKKVCNTDAELEEYLKNECNNDKESAKYKEMLAVKADYDRVEAEFSKITKSKYKINVDLIFYTQEEYMDMIEKTMEEYALETARAEKAERALMKYVNDYKAAYPDADYPDKRLGLEFLKYYEEYAKYIDLDTIFEDEDGEKKSAIDDQYKENELGIKELVYPDSQPGQLDIIYISGLDMYNEYIDNEYLKPLDETINSLGKKLNDYITNALLDGVKVNGSTYAIPNNVKIGEYTYMMVDKELLDKYYVDPVKINDVVSLESFLTSVNELEPNRLPLDASFKDCMDQFVWYWNIDWTENDDGTFTYAINTENKFSVIGALYGDPKNAGRGKIELGFNSLFADERYRTIYKTLKKYEFDGIYPTENDERTNPAVYFVNDDYSIKKLMDDANEGKSASDQVNYSIYKDEETGKEYYAYVVKYPEVGEKELYGNMFGVSANSVNTESCIKVLTLLNTNAEFRNILQYGVKDVDYEIDEETGILSRKKTNYLMDIEKTGNCFIAYPEEGNAPDYWEDAKKQNNDALINPLLGFDINRQLAEYNATLDNSFLDFLGMDSDPIIAEYPLTKGYSWQIQEQIDACTDYEELVDLLDNAQNGLVKVLDPAASPKITVLYKDKDGTIKETKDHALQLVKIIDKTYRPAAGDDENSNEKPKGESPYTMYYNWMNAYKYLPK